MEKATKTIAAAAFVIAVIGLITIISHLVGMGKNEPVSKDSFYFDTTCTISIYDESLSEEEAMALIDKAFGSCRKYENLLSRTVEGSDVWKINNAEGSAVTCDTATIECMKSGLGYSRISDGGFDISVGRLVDLWDYHQENARPPEKKELEKALKHVGYKDVLLDEDAGTVQVPKGMEIDLGGVAKGYIADRICEELQEASVEGAVVNFGGNVECVGDKYGEDFTIGIERPYSDRRELIGATSLKAGTVTTSGVYERFFEYKGKKYHHILDTKTGMPVKTDLLSVTITGPEGTSADCDALATICLIQGYERGRKLIEGEPGIEALFITEEGKTEMTEGFVFEAAN